MNTKTIKSGSQHTIDITTDRSGRTSIVIYEGFGYVNSNKIIDVELPAKSGEYKDAFKPCVKIVKGVEIEEIN